MTLSPAAGSTTLRGIAWLVFGVAVFSLQDVIIKTLGEGDIPVFQFILLRTLFSFAPLALLIAFEGGIRVLRVTRPWLHVLRGALLLASYVSYFLGVASLPLAEAVALAYSAPLWVTAMSILFLGDRVGWHRWAALIIGFVGILVMLRPDAGLPETGAIFAALTPVAYGLATILTRRIGANDSSVSMVTTMSLVYLAGSSIAGAILWDGSFTGPGDGAAIAFLLGRWVVPSWLEIGLLALCGLVAIGGFYGLVQAYRLAVPSRVAPFEYTGVIWGVVWGFALWDEIPDGATLLGILIVAGSGLYIVHRESRAQRDEA